MTSDQRGVALVLALLAMSMMVAFGAALVLTAATESKIARNFSLASEAAYAAGAALERALDDVEAERNWNSVLNGARRSPFADGAPSGPRWLADGTSIDLDAIVSMANCRQLTPCSDDDMNRVTDERPWGLDNPRWQLFAWGRMNDLTMTASVKSPFYILVLVADDEAECDHDPFTDGGPPVPPCGGGFVFNPGTGVLSLRAEAFGPFGTHRVIEARVARADAGTAVRLLSWHEKR